MNYSLGASFPPTVGGKDGLMIVTEEER